MNNDDGLDIPSFLRIPQARRRAAWAEFDARPRRAQNHALDDRGPGSVARRLGFPENPRDEELRAALQAREEAQRLAKRESDLARLAEWKAARVAEQAEIEEVKARARAAHLGDSP
jgi:hypothetical protein